MKFRHHREFLDDALKTTVEVKDLYSLKEYLKGKGYKYTDDLTVEKYGTGVDERCGWDTYIVHSDSWGVYGFTDGALI